MPQRQRGLDIIMKVAVEGVLRPGLFENVTGLTVNNRDELTETPLLGKDVDTVDYIHNGWDLQWTAQPEDADGIDFCDQLVSLQKQRLPLPPITISIEYRYRDPSIQNRLVVYRGVVLKPDSESFQNRQDYVENQYSAKAERRSTIVLPA
jgi:hypothetical protein